MITDPSEMMVDEDNALLPGEKEFKLQVIHRVMKKALPDHALVSKDAKSLIEENVVALIQNVTKNARKVAGENHRTKIKGRDLVKVFLNCGLFLYGNVLDAYLETQQDRDTTSALTETDDSGQDEKTKNTGKVVNHITNADAPQDATGNGMFSDHVVSDCTSDPPSNFQFPKTAEQICSGTTERNDSDIFGSMDDDDLMGEENCFPDRVRMPDSWINQIIQNQKDSDSSPSQMPNTTSGVDDISDLPASLAVPSRALTTRPTTGVVSSSTDVPALTVHVNNVADIDGGEPAVLDDVPSPVNSFSTENHRISIPAWTITPTTVSGVCIPPIHIPSFTVEGGEVTDILGTDATGLNHQQEGQREEEPSEYKSDCGAQDDGLDVEMGEIDPTRANSGEAGPMWAMEDPNNPFFFEFEPDSFDTESLLDYTQGSHDQ